MFFIKTLIGDFLLLTMPDRAYTLLFVRIRSSNITSSTLLLYLYPSIFTVILFEKCYMACIDKALQCIKALKL